ncbi:glycosyltransferase [Shewanella surugensis]|uniref:Glycosyltransferase n=1 Tax=Shewanella surugensis TaxID=212020 RepID=A0ABT0LJH5_9GAMM|nr:glycosyltransferase [Shewanella surugensis]MCL1127841.1 glycosyltransferase [Shewanella surugensis]
MITKILVVSSSVAPVGEGGAGGVDVTLTSFLACMAQFCNCKIDILVPDGSTIKNETGKVIFSSGTCSIPAQNLEYNDKILLYEDDVSLSFMELCYKVQSDYDLILNLSYDYMPFYLTDFFDTPMFHLVSMGRTSRPMSYIIKKVYNQSPNRIAFHSFAQARSFGISDFQNPLYVGLQSRKYTFYDKPVESLVTASRIAPEKGLEDALEVARLLKLPIKIMGAADDDAYLQYLMHRYQDVEAKWLGFLEHDDFIRQIGNARMAIATPKWEEAMGIANIEATLSGVPVAAYDRGGIKEVIFHGKTGFISRDASPVSIANYYHEALGLDRNSIKEFAGKKLSLESFFGRLCCWFSKEGIQMETLCR